MAGFDDVFRVFNQSLTTDAKQPEPNVHIKCKNNFNV
jgi:hypothetical protein